MNDYHRLRLLMSKGMIKRLILLGATVLFLGYVLATII